VTEKRERVAVYMRVSSDEQRERETIEIQDGFLGQYADLYKLNIVAEYRDEGISGTVPLHERPEGRRLLEDAKAGRFDVLLVYKLDRLGRSLLVIVEAHDLLAGSGAGVALRSAREPIDTSNPGGRLIFQMLASFAEYDRESILERTRAGVTRAFRRGTQMGFLPFGYRTDEAGELEIVAEEAELVREIIEGVADGSTLYGVAKRLNDLGLPSPGRRYPGGERKPGRSWSATTIHNIVHQRAYSGVHEVTIKDTGETIERPAPAIVSEALQGRAQASLRHNRRYRDRETDRRYLLAGLVRCAVCGHACVGHSATARGTKYHYYRATCGRTGEGVRSGASLPHRAPFLNAAWLEGLVWGDVRRFLENPGETLERLRAQTNLAGDTGELEARRADLAKRLTAKQTEKDRYVRLYAQEHISEEELETHILDVGNQIENLRLLIGSVEADLSRKRQQSEIAETTHAWLLTLRERLSEVERDTEGALRDRRRLVRLLVAEVVAGEKREDGTSEVRITYRFDPPDEPETDGDGRGLVVATVPKDTSLS
jgi:site-specific DNA recombinase